jgi:hypothetical protein
MEDGLKEKEMIIFLYKVTFLDSPKVLIYNSITYSSSSEEEYPDRSVRGRWCHFEIFLVLILLIFPTFEGYLTFNYAFTHYTMGCKS